MTESNRWRNSRSHGFLLRHITTDTAAVAGGNIRSAVSIQRRSSVRCVEKMSLVTRTQQEEVEMPSRVCLQWQVFECHRSLDEEIMSVGTNYEELVSPLNLIYHIGPIVTTSRPNCTRVRTVGLEKTFAGTMNKCILTTVRMITPCRLTRVTNYTQQIRFSFKDSSSALPCTSNNLNQWTLQSNISVSECRLANRANRL